MPRSDTSHLPLHTRAAALAEPVFFRETGRFRQLFFGKMPAGEGDHLLLFDGEKKTALCSCPFFPKPCVHALAFARLAAEGETFAEKEQLPEWATALLHGRPTAARSTASTAEQRQAGAQKRRFERLERAANGMGDLEAWLLDTLRRGLATAVSDDAAFAGNIAARAVDASLSGIGRRLRALHELPATQPGWADRTLATLAGIHLALRAFRRRDELPAALLHDLETYLGFPVKKDEALHSGDRATGVWAVAGRREEPLENQLMTRRTWLCGEAGEAKGRFALLLDFAFGQTGAFPPGLTPGERLRGTLSFYPSAFPLRALFADDPQLLPETATGLPGMPDFQTFATDWAAALGQQPWLSLAPAAFPALTPAVENGRFFLVDPAQQAIPLAGLAADGWKLLALSGGRPIGVFGEWDGESIRVLSALVEGRFVPF